MNGRPDLTIFCLPTLPDFQFNHYVPTFILWLSFPSPLPRIEPHPKSSCCSCCCCCCCVCMQKGLSALTDESENSSLVFGHSKLVGHIPCACVIVWCSLCRLSPLHLCRLLSGCMTTTDSIPSLLTLTRCARNGSSSRSLVMMRSSFFGAKACLALTEAEEKGTDRA